MSEPLNEIHMSSNLSSDLGSNLDFELDYDLDSDLGSDFGLVAEILTEAVVGENTPQVEGESTSGNLRALPVRVPTLTNSPGCLPGFSSSSSGGESRSVLPPVRRARTVKVDAWAVPASANWGRSRRTMRKVSRVSRSTDWALPF